MANSLAPNVAALLPTKQGRFTIGERHIPTPGEGELLVRNEAVAANPADWKVQELGILVNKFPAVLGSDLAGVVLSVGRGVTRFKEGDRVMGFALGVVADNSDQSAFQTYTVLREIATARLPANITFEQGAVLPVAMATAAVALFADLGLPMHEKSDKEPGGILVWSGASAVGVAAVQLAHLLGWHVYTTASPSHHAWLKEAGATEVWDYRDPQVTQKISQAAKAAVGKISGAIDARAEGDSFDLVAATLVAAGSTSQAKICTVQPWPEDKPKPEGIEASFVNCARIISDRQDIGHWLFNNRLSEKLEEGKIKPAPKPRVIVGGLAAAQTMVDTLKAGVSGEKLVLKIST